MQEESTYYPPNSMAIAARFTGLVAVFTTICTTIIIPCVLSVLAIIFAILSNCNPIANSKDAVGAAKGKMHVLAKRTIVTAIITILLNLSIAGYTGYRFFADDVFRSQFETTFEQVSGMTFDDYLTELKNAYTGSVPEEELR